MGAQERWLVRVDGRENRDTDPSSVPLWTQLVVRRECAQWRSSPSARVSRIRGVIASKMEPRIVKKVDFVDDEAHRTVIPGVERLRVMTSHFSGVVTVTRVSEICCLAICESPVSSPP